MDTGWASPQLTTATPNFAQSIYTAPHQVVIVCNSTVSFLVWSMWNTLEHFFGRLTGCSGKPKHDYCKNLEAQYSYVFGNLPLLVNSPTLQLEYIDYYQNTTNHPGYPSAAIWNEPRTCLVPLHYLRRGINMNRNIYRRCPFRTSRRHSNICDLFLNFQWLLKKSPFQIFWGLGYGDDISISTTARSAPRVVNGSAASISLSNFRRHFFRYAYYGNHFAPH